MKAQISFEIFILVALVFLALTIITATAGADAVEQGAIIQAKTLVKTLSNAVELVNILGNGSQKTVRVYVPEGINASRTFAANGTIKYGIQTRSGTSDIFSFINTCVAGHLPKHPGYYNTIIYFEENCTYIDYISKTGLERNCWGLNYYCDNKCLFSELGETPYYENQGCSSNCTPSGNFYIPVNSCSDDGSGDCYKFFKPLIKSTTCFIGEPCLYECYGNCTLCSELLIDNCEACGCNLTDAEVSTVKWYDDLSSDSDWAPWAVFGNGISYVTDADNCINDGNNTCMQVRRGASPYTLFKQSDINLSACVPGTGFLNISHVKTFRNLAGGDCVYISFSNDSGITWGANNQVFCGNLPSVISYSLLIPDSYLTSSFRVRVVKTGFNTPVKNAWLDGFTASCNTIKTICTGEGNNCAYYTNNTACTNCGCTWNSTAWYWTTGGESIGFEDFEQCEWYD